MTHMASPASKSVAASPSSPSRRRAELGELLHVLMLPDFERADRIGDFWGHPESRALAELLIDCEEDRVLRAVLVGMLRGMTRSLGLPGHGEPAPHGELAV